MLMAPQPDVTQQEQTVIRKGRARKATPRKIRKSTEINNASEGADRGQLSEDSEVPMSSSQESDIPVSSNCENEELPIEGSEITDTETSELERDDPVDDEFSDHPVTESSEYVSSDHMLTGASDIECSRLPVPVSEAVINLQTNIDADNITQSISFVDDSSIGAVIEAECSTTEQIQSAVDVQSNVVQTVMDSAQTVMEVENKSRSVDCDIDNGNSVDNDIIKQSSSVVKDTINKSSSLDNDGINMSSSVDNENNIRKFGNIYSLKSLSTISTESPAAYEKFISKRKKQSKKKRRLTEDKSIIEIVHEVLKKKKRKSRCNILSSKVGSWTITEKPKKEVIEVCENQVRQVETSVGKLIDNDLFNNSEKDNIGYDAKNHDSSTGMLEIEFHRTVKKENLEKDVNDGNTVTISEGAEQNTKTCEPSGNQDNNQVHMEVSSSRSNEENLIPSSSSVLYQQISLEKETDCDSVDVSERKTYGDITSQSKRGIVMNEGDNKLDSNCAVFSDKEKTMSIQNVIISNSLQEGTFTKAETNNKNIESIDNSSKQQALITKVTMETELSDVLDIEKKKDSEIIMKDTSVSLDKGATLEMKKDYKISLKETSTGHDSEISLKTEKDSGVNMSERSHATEQDTEGTEGVSHVTEHDMEGVSHVTEQDMEGVVVELQPGSIRQTGGTESLCTKEVTETVLHQKVPISRDEIVEDICQTSRGAKSSCQNETIMHEDEMLKHTEQFIEKKSLVTQSDKDNSLTDEVSVEGKSPKKKTGPSSQIEIIAEEEKTPLKEEVAELYQTKTYKEMKSPAKRSSKESIKQARDEILEDKSHRTRKTRASGQYESKTQEDKMFKNTGEIIVKKSLSTQSDKDKETPTDDFLEGKSPKKKTGPSSQIEIIAEEEKTPLKEEVAELYQTKTYKETKSPAKRSSKESIKQARDEILEDKSHRTRKTRASGHYESKTQEDKMLKHTGQIIVKKSLSTQSDKDKETPTDEVLEGKSRKKKTGPLSQIEIIAEEEKTPLKEEVAELYQTKTYKETKSPAKRSSKESIKQARDEILEDKSHRTRKTRASGQYESKTQEDKMFKNTGEIIVKKSLSTQSDKDKETPTDEVLEGKSQKKKTGPSSQIETIIQKDETSVQKEVVKLNQTETSKETKSVAKPSDEIVKHKSLRTRKGRSSGRNETVTRKDETPLQKELNCTETSKETKSLTKLSGKETLKQVKDEIVEDKSHRTRKRRSSGRNETITQVDKTSKLIEKANDKKSLTTLSDKDNKKTSIHEVVNDRSHRNKTGPSNENEIILVDDEAPVLQNDILKLNQMEGSMGRKAQATLTSNKSKKLSRDEVVEHKSSKVTGTIGSPIKIENQEEKTYIEQPSEELLQSDKESPKQSKGFDKKMLADIIDSKTKRTKLPRLFNETKVEKEETSLITKKVCKSNKSDKPTSTTSQIHRYEQEVPLTIVEDKTVERRKSRSILSPREETATVIDENVDLKLKDKNNTIDTQKEGEFSEIAVSDKHSTLTRTPKRFARKIVKDKNDIKAVVSEEEYPLKDNKENKGITKDKYVKKTEEQNIQQVPKKLSEKRLRKEECESIGEKTDGKVNESLRFLFEYKSDNKEVTIKEDIESDTFSHPTSNKADASVCIELSDTDDQMKNINFKGTRLDIQTKSEIDNSKDVHKMTDDGNLDSSEAIHDKNVNIQVSNESSIEDLISASIADATEDDTEDDDTTEAMLYESENESVWDELGVEDMSKEPVLKREVIHAKIDHEEIKSNEPEVMLNEQVDDAMLSELVAEDTWNKPASETILDQSVSQTKSNRSDVFIGNDDDDTVTKRVNSKYIRNKEKPNINSWKRRNVEKELVIETAKKPRITSPTIAAKKRLSPIGSVSTVPHTKKIGVSRRFKYGKLPSLTSKKPSVQAEETDIEDKKLNVHQEHDDIMTLMKISSFNSSGNKVNDKQVDAVKSFVPPPVKPVINRTVEIISHPVINKSMFDIDFHIEPSANKKTEDFVEAPIVQPIKNNSPDLENGPVENENMLSVNEENLLNVTEEQVTVLNVELYLKLTEIILCN